MQLLNMRTTRVLLDKNKHTHEYTTRVCKLRRGLYCIIIKNFGIAGSIAFYRWDVLRLSNHVYVYYSYIGHTYLLYYDFNAVYLNSAAEVPYSVLSIAWFGVCMCVCVCDLGENPFLPVCR